MRLYYFPAPVPIQSVFITRNMIFAGTREARLDFLVKIAKGFLSAAELDDVVSAQEYHVIFWLFVDLCQLQVVLAVSFSSRL